MDTADIPLLAMLRGRLNYLTQRQQVIAENVANADTPGFAPRELTPFQFQAQMQTAQAAGPQAMAATEPGHMAPPHAGTEAAKPIITRDSETRLDGNSVVLEEEMMKMGQARMDYDAAITFYQKALSLIRLAARAPGHS
jgi:flagellar basal-body rod protein FlgB